MRRGNSGFVLVMAALAAAVLLGGCRQTNVAKDRMRVLEAENIDARQRATTAEKQQRDSQLVADRAVADLQHTRHQVNQLQGENSTLHHAAAEGEQAKQALAMAIQDRQRQMDQVKHLRSEVGRMADLAARQPKPTPVIVAKTPPSMRYEVSEQAEAFRRDVENRLAAAGIDLPVEMRTTQRGQHRVAVVLRGAFPSGKDSLAYNMDAVRAVVGLGELIAASYSGSRIRVEGHTDSDPIRKSPWKSNEALSRARAEQVRKLLTKSGVPSSSIEVVGNGARTPLERGTSKRAKAMNRRVEIYILPSA